MGQHNCPQCGASVHELAQACSVCGSHFNHGIHPFALFGFGLLASMIASFIFHWSVVPGLFAFGLVFYGLYLATKDRVSVRHRRDL